MIILRLVYIAVVLAAVAYILQSRSKLSFLSIYILSSIIYHMNALTGVVYYAGDMVRYFPTPVATETYVILILNVGIALVWLIASDMSPVERPAPNAKLGVRENNLAMLFVSGGVLLLLSYKAVQFLPYILEGVSKSEFLQEISLLESFLLQSIPIITAYAFFSRGKYVGWLRAFAVFLNIVPVFTYAMRSYLVFFALILGYLLVNRSRTKSLLAFILRFKAVFIAALLFTLGVFFLKPLIPSLTKGNWAAVGRIARSDGLFDALRYSEANTIATNLNELVHRDFRVDMATYRFSLMKLVPLMGTITRGYVDPVSFNDLFQDALFPYAMDYGRASTFLGEAWSNGGLALVFLAANAVCMALHFGEKALRRGENTFIQATILACMPSMAFYLYRNSFSYALTDMSKTIYLGLMCLLAAAALSSVLWLRRRQALYTLPARPRRYLQLYDDFFRGDLR